MLGGMLADAPKREEGRFFAFSERAFALAALAAALLSIVAAVVAWPLHHLAAIAIAVVIPPTATGVELDVSVPLPSAPLLLSPQQSTLPPERRAQVWSWPAAMAMAVVIPVTATGIVLPVVVPLPSSP